MGNPTTTQGKEMTMQVTVINARNVNDALQEGIKLFDTPLVARQDCRANPAGSVTIEHCGPVLTMYQKPAERVLFSPLRNANPFFHFFETLWILSGRNDVEWLAHFNKRMLEFADVGMSTFHGAYGHRLRHPYDQFRFVINELSRRPDSRRATMAIFRSEQDHIPSKDIPCNCTVSFLVRSDELHMTVYNRSNDMVWGAYGANVVQFSTIQELLARCIGVAIGTYTQISNSFHVYETEPTWGKLATQEEDDSNSYTSGFVQPFNMLLGVDRMASPSAKLSAFDASLSWFMHLTESCIKERAMMASDKMRLPYLNNVALPLFNAWQCYQRLDLDNAMFEAGKCMATDWKLAAINWLKRTRMKKAASVSSLPL